VAAHTVADTPAKRYAPAVKVCVLNIGGGGGGGEMYSGNVTIGGRSCSRGGRDFMASAAARSADASGADSFGMGGMGGSVCDISLFCFWNCQDGIEDVEGRRCSISDFVNPLLSRKAALRAREAFLTSEVSKKRSACSISCSRD
jgi:hypothetical protein